MTEGMDQMVMGIKSMFLSMVYMNCTIGGTCIVIYNLYMQIKYRKQKIESINKWIL